MWDWVLTDLSKSTTRRRGTLEQKGTLPSLFKTLQPINRGPRNVLYHEMTWKEGRISVGQREGLSPPVGKMDRRDLTI